MLLLLSFSFIIKLRKHICAIVMSSPGQCAGEVVTDTNRLVLMSAVDVLTHTLLSAVGNMSDCRSRGSKFDPSPVPYFHGD